MIKMGEEKREEYVSILKPWIIIAAVLMPPIFWFLNMPLHAFVQWWVWPAWFPPHFLIVIAILWLWRKWTGRPMPCPQYLVAIFTMCYIVSGWSYLQYGIHYWTFFPMFTNWGHYVRGLWDETYRTLTWGAFPWFTAPHDLDVLRAFYEGGIYNAGPWLPSIAFASLYLIILYCGGYFWVVPLYKPSVKVEKHAFPYVAPMAYTIDWATREMEGKISLLNFRITLSKLFWAGFVLGAPTYIPSMISALTPITFPIYLISPPVNAWIQSILEHVPPGAMFSDNSKVFNLRSRLSLRLGKR